MLFERRFRGRRRRRSKSQSDSGSSLSRSRSRGRRYSLSNSSRSRSRRDSRSNSLSSFSDSGRSASRSSFSSSRSRSRSRHRSMSKSRSRSRERRYDGGKREWNSRRRPENVDRYIPPSRRERGLGRDRSRKRDSDRGRYAETKSRGKTRRLSPDITRIKLKSLSKNVTSAHLKEIFNHFGEIVEISLVTDEKTGISRGYGFIEYQNGRSAQTAVDTMHDGIIDGKKVFCELQARVEANVAKVQDRGYSIGRDTGKASVERAKGDGKGYWRRDKNVNSPNKSRTGDDRRQRHPRRDSASSGSFSD